MIWKREIENNSVEGAQNEERQYLRERVNTIKKQGRE